MAAGFQIGTVRLDGSFGLSPMAGVGDYAFRHMCRSMGASYTVTEMISAKALCYGDKKTAQLLQLSPLERPAAVQIFGCEPDFLAKGAVLALKESGAQVLDLNMGCPAGKIIRSGEGSALMKTPELAERCIRAVVGAVDVPVTVKFRAGWDETRRNAVEFAQMAENAGASALCIHGRTQSQQYSGRADRALMAAVVAAVSIPVMVNGDVIDGASGVELLRETGARFAMIGRGALGNPWIFRECESMLRGEPFSQPPLEERLRTVREQITLAAAQKGERVACREARAHLAHYLRGIRSAARLRDLSSRVATLPELDALIELVLAAAADTI